MRQKIMRTVPAVAWMFAGVVPWSAAAAQDAAPPSLDEQLRAQYKVVKMGADSGGLKVLEPGTVLVVQKSRILGVPWKSMAFCPAKYEDGNLHAPNAFCASMFKDTSRYFQPHEKVYPLKIEVNLKKDRISFRVVACDSCDGTDPATFFKSELTLQFDKGSLEKANAGQIEDMIGQVFAIDNGAGEEQAQNSQGAQAAPAEQPAQPQPPAPAEPQKISLGQTPEQVQAAFGQPEKVVDLGAKQIFVYKDLKVTFVNGKVTDVQ